MLKSHWWPVFALTLFWLIINLFIPETMIMSCPSSCLGSFFIQKRGFDWSVDCNLTSPEPNSCREVTLFAKTFTIIKIPWPMMLSITRTGCPALFYQHLTLWTLKNATDFLQKTGLSRHNYIQTMILIFLPSLQILIKQCDQEDTVESSPTLSHISNRIKCTTFGLVAVFIFLTWCWQYLLRSTLSQGLW